MGDRKEPHVGDGVIGAGNGHVSHVEAVFPDQGALPMRCRSFLPAVIAVGLLCLASASNASAFELLNRMMGGGGGCGGCGCDAAPACGCDIAPSCGCEVSCCAPKCREPRCCRQPRCGRVHLHRHCCAPTCGCETTCAAPAPTCGCDAAPACGCDSCCEPKCRQPRCCRERCRPSLLDCLRACRSCCQPTCCAPVCEPTCGCNG